MATLTKDQIEEYFENYIKEYTPFKNNNIYQTLLRYLVDYYYDILYNQTPELYKTMFENSEIPVQVYDKLLVAIGLPEILIEKLSYNSKVIFLKTFSDFERYKSSLSFVQNLGKSYKDFLNIYELFIDYDNVTSQWVLRPKLIYKSDRVDEFTDFLIYDEIYPTVPTLLVDSTQLTNLKNNEQLVLPIKSNLLLLDYELSEPVSVLYNLINSVFIKTYGNNYIQLYFDDFSYSVNLREIYFLWFYLLTRYYKTVWRAFPLNFILNFHDKTNPFFITDLDQMLDEYDEIDSKRKFDDFYEKYLMPFAKYFRTLDDYSHQDMSNILQVLNEDLIDYINNRIDQAIDEKKEIKAITDEIYNSIIIDINTSPDPLYQKYSEYFLLTLSQLSVKPEDTDTYLILYNLKPYHTEIITKSRRSIYCEDKFNQIHYDEEIFFIMSLIRASLINICDTSDFIFTYKYSDTQQILSSFNTIFKFYSEEQIIEILDSFSILEKMKAVSLETISDEDYSKEVSKISNSTFSILDGEVIKTSDYYDTQYFFNDLAVPNTVTKQASLPTISDRNQKNKIIYSDQISNFNIISNLFIKLFKMKLQENYNLNESIKTRVYHSDVSLPTISDRFEIIDN